MHVVFLSKRYWPAIGGVEKHLVSLCDALLQLRPDVQITVVTERYDRALPVFEEHRNIKIHRIPLTPSPENPDLKKSMWSWVKAHQSLFAAADIVHVHDVFFWLLPLLTSWSLPKIYTTFHGYEPPGPPNWRQQSWHQLAEVLSDGNMCVGEFHQKWYGVQPTITTFGAVDQSYIAVEKQSNAKPGTFVFVGRLDEDTGIWQYLEVLAQLDGELNGKSKTYQGYHLDIVGDGPLRQQLEWFVEQAGLSVRFLGAQVTQPTLYQKYSCSLVSGYLTILESLAAGVPVVAAYATALKKDYLEMTPFAPWILIAQPGSELVAAIKEVPLISEAARSWARHQTWSQLAQSYLQLWGQG